MNATTVSPEFTAKLNATYDRMTAGLKTTVRDYDWRLGQLKKLKQLLDENQAAFEKALWSDLRKSPFECQATEQGVVMAEINDALKNLKAWMRPQRVSTPLFNWPGRSLIKSEPYGLTLVIGAWNYPINLTLAPLVGAIAGGNACIIKPSEIAANTAELLSQLIPKYLDSNCFSVIQGGADETGALLDKKFDFIFFTGSGPVGKIVLAKAAPHLTPVVLELGGKSPAIVWKDADLKVVGRRLAWAKFMNAGQTCIAPDYILVHPSVKNELAREISANLTEFFGANAQASPDYCRIINEKNFDRLIGLVNPQKVIRGGKSDRSDKYIEPTLVDASSDDPVMQQEIFGPVLPILAMENVDQVADFINSRPKPLALYVFSQDESVRTQMIESTSSGAVVINDAVMHMPEAQLPFGGVGDSGMGNYHGKFGYQTFTHAKGVLKKTTRFDLPVRYAPYNESKRKILSWLFR